MQNTDRAGKAERQRKGGQVEKRGEWAGGGGNMGRESRAETNTVNVYGDRKVLHNRSQAFKPF